MATLVPSASLQPRDPPLYWSCRGPPGKDEDNRGGFMTSSSALLSTPSALSSNSVLGRKVSCGFKVTGRRNKTILSRKVTFTQPLSKLNPLKMILNRTAVHVAFVACLQPHLWLSGAGLTFLTRLHFLLTPTAGYQKQSMVCTGMETATFVTDRELVETAVNVSALACS